MCNRSIIRNQWKLAQFKLKTWTAQALGSLDFKIVTIYGGIGLIMAERLHLMILKAIMTLQL